MLIQYVHISPIEPKMYIVYMSQEQYIPAKLVCMWVTCCIMKR